MCSIRFAVSRYFKHYLVYFNLISDLYKIKYKFDEGHLGFMINTKEVYFPKDYSSYFLNGSDV